MKNKILRCRRRYLAICGLGLLFVGIIYAWSILKVPFAESFGWQSSELALNYTISMSFFCIGSLLAGWLFKKIRPAVLLLTGAFLTGVGFCLTAMLSGRSILLLYLFYGVLGSLGIGIAYNALLTIGNAWFPDKKGTSSGLLMMCFGLSSLVLGKLAAAMFDAEMIGWHRGYLILGILIAIVLAICAVTLRLPGSTDALPEAAKKKRNAENVTVRDYTPTEMIRRPTFWIYYVYGILAAAVGSATISFAKELIMSFGADASFAATLVGVLSLCNGLGRVLCGLSFDQFGRKSTMLLASLITLAAPAMMLAALFSGSLPLAAAALGVTGISFGTAPTIGSAFISTFYGTKHYAINYGISNSKLMISSFAATLASMLLTTTGGYVAPFAMLFCMAAASMGLCFLIRKP